MRAAYTYTTILLYIKREGSSLECSCLSYAIHRDILYYKMRAAYTYTTILLYIKREGPSLERSCLSYAIHRDILYYKMRAVFPSHVLYD